MPEDLAHDVQLAVDEAATNIITHGYRGQEGFLEIEIWREGGALAIRISDEAEPFDPTRLPPLDPSLSPEERVLQGVGVHLMRHVMDDITHRITLK